METNQKLDIILKELFEIYLQSISFDVLKMKDSIKAIISDDTELRNTLLSNLIDDDKYVALVNGYNGISLTPNGKRFYESGSYVINSSIKIRLTKSLKENIKWTKIRVYVIIPGLIIAIISAIMSIIKYWDKIIHIIK
jgi:hypothetical protein